MAERDAAPSTAEVIATLASLHEWLRENLDRLSRGEQQRLMEKVEALVLAFRRGSQ